MKPRVKKFIIIGVVLVVIFGGSYGVDAIFTRDLDIPVVNVRKGPFLISLKINGQIDAQRAYVISSPRIRGLQITWLAPEGSTVQIGDPVIKFDATKQMS